MLDGCTEKDWVRAWLCEKVLPHWWAVGRDAETGGFFEALDFEGRPLTHLNRRGRVAPRQLYSFAVAKSLGLFDAPDLLVGLTEGCDYLNKTARMDDGRFAGSLAPDGTTVLSAAKLYDMAFIALAGSELYKLKIPGADLLMETAFLEIDARFRDRITGGFIATAGANSKLANPHMHLLEASICCFDATQGKHSGEMIAELLNVFEENFFDPENGIVHEIRNHNFGPSKKSWVEPGHGLEWAYLYLEASKRLGRSGDRVARHLWEAAETSAIGNLIPNKIVARNPDHTFRLWPQLERLRTRYTILPHSNIEPLLYNLRTLYFSPGPDVGWVDEVDIDGVSIAPNMPSSMLYHLMTSLGPLLTKQSKA